MVNDPQNMTSTNIFHGMHTQNPYSREVKSLLKRGYMRKHTNSLHVRSSNIQSSPNPTLLRKYIHK